MPRAEILGVANQKGGVGKTTTAVNLAAALAALNRRVLLIDLDPQGNASTGLGHAAAGRRQGSYTLLTERNVALEQVMRATPQRGLHVVVGEADLSGFDLEMAEEADREFLLRKRLHADQAMAQLDHVVLDCPPSLNLLTVNALTAADRLLVPLQCEFLALEGISQLTYTLERVQRHLNPKLRLDGIVLTMFDRRAGLSAQVEAEVRGIFGSRVFRTVIPRNVRLSEAPSHGLPIGLYDPRSPGAVAYRHLAEELLEREKARAL